MSNTYLGQLLVVGTGGFIGSAARYALSGLVHRGFPSLAFPVGTLAVNIVGCLAIGVLGGLLETRQVLGPSVKEGVATIEKVEVRKFGTRENPA